MFNLKRKAKLIPYVYNHGSLINNIIKLLKRGDFKTLLLLFLLDSSSKFFRNRNDYFEVSSILSSIFKQYSLNCKNINLDLRPLEIGLYGYHDPKTLDKKKEFLSILDGTPLRNRPFLFQQQISNLEYAVNGGNEKWFKTKEDELKVASENYPSLSQNDLILAPDWYLAIGHICLLGYLGIAYPKKFTLLVVEGTESANKDLFEIVSANFKIIKCKPIIYSSLLVSQPGLFFSIDSIRFSGKCNPVSHYVNQAISKLPSRSYIYPTQKSSISEYLDQNHLKGHTIYPNFITLHIRGNSHDDPNNPSTPARDANINSYKLAIKYLISKGYNVVRIGDYLSGGISFIDGFIDLTKFLRNKNQDISLLANAKFHIATASGPMNVPPLFGIPVLLTNSVRPFIQPSYPLSFSIPKRCYDYKKNDYMPFDKFLNSDIVLEEMRRSFPNGLFLKDNTDQEILDAVIDILELISLDSESSRQETYKTILLKYKEYLRTHSIENSQSHMPLAPSFLKKVIEE